MADYFFPNASDSANSKPPEPKEKEKEPEKKAPAVTDAVVVKRGFIGRLVNDVFDLDDIPGKFKRFYKQEVIPFVKDGLNKGGKSLIDSFTHTETAGSSQSSSPAGKYAWSPFRSTQQTAQQKDTQQTQSSQTAYFDAIEYETMGKAEVVLDDMKAYREKYGYVNVAFMFEDSGITNTNYTMTTFGWTDAAELEKPQAYVERIWNGKYRIKLPKAHTLKTR